MKHFYFCAASVFFIAFILTGCDKSDDSSICWKNYTKSDGLASRKISAIASDSMSNIWVGTNGDGLFVYNGIEWIQYFTLKYSYINCIEADADHIWVGTSEGILQGDFEHNFTIYTTDDGLMSNYISCIAEDSKKNIWVGTDKGISMFDGEVWTNYPMCDLSDVWDRYPVYSAVADADNHIWFGTDDGLLENDGTDWNRYFSKPVSDVPVIYSYSDYSIHSLAVDPQNNKWVGNDGIKIFDGVDYQQYTSDDGLMSNTINHIAFDKDGNAWLGSYKGIMQLSGSTYKYYTEHNGLPDNDVIDITVDTKGVVWCATEIGIAFFCPKE